MKTNNSKNVGELFNQLFNNITTVYSFNKNWHASQGRLSAVINHEKYRLIMTPGHIARTVDNFKRKIILIGGEHGLICLYQNTPGVLGKMAGDISCEEGDKDLNIAYNKKVSLPVMSAFMRFFKEPEKKVDPILQVMAPEHLDALDKLAADDNAAFMAQANDAISNKEEVDLALEQELAHAAKSAPVTTELETQVAVQEPEVA